MAFGFSPPTQSRLGPIASHLGMGGISQAPSQQPPYSLSGTTSAPFDPRQVLTHLMGRTPPPPQALAPQTPADASPAAPQAPAAPAAAPPAQGGDGPSVADIIAKVLGF
jgi:hypothetical protein